MSKVRALVYYSLKLSLPISIVISVAIFLLSYNISTLFHSPGLAQILQIIVFSIPFSVATSVFLGLIMGLKYPKYRIYIDDLIKPTSRFIFILFSLFIGLGLAGIALSYVVSFLLSCIVGFYIFLKIVPTKSLPITKKEKTHLFSYSWPLMFTGIIFIIMGQIDTLMIGFFKLSEDVGVYNAALPTVDILSIAPLSLMALFLPIITELYTRNRIADVAALYKRVIKWTLILIMPVFLLFTIFPAQILDILFGYDYLSGALSLSILSIGFFIGSLFYTSQDIINLFKKTKIHMLVSGFVVLLNLFLDYLLIPTYGILGAAIATAISYSILGILGAIIAYKYFRFSPLTWKTLRVALSGAVTFIFFFSVNMFIDLNAFLFLILILPSTLIVYALFLLLFNVFDSEDLTILKSIGAKLGVRIGFLRRIVRIR